MGGCLFVAAASAMAPLVPVMPDGQGAPEGLPHVAIPMHLLAGVVAALVVPLVVHWRPHRAVRRPSLPPDAVTRSRTDGR
jgi:hypothetical protein